VDEERDYQRRCSVIYHVDGVEYPGNIDRTEEATNLPMRQLKDVRYLSWLRRLPCCVSGKSGLTHVHHVRTKRNCCAGRKPDDRFGIPMSPDLHLMGHRIGWETFERRFKVDLLEMAKYYNCMFFKRFGRWPRGTVINY
jgi:hypothetical protein